MLMRTSRSARRPRALLALVAKLSATALALGISGGAASTVLQPTAAHACTWGPYQYNVDAETPLWYWGVSDWGSFYGYPDAGCGALFIVYNETKVCGFWGCSYESRGDSGGFRHPNGQRTRLNAGAPCRKGINRYRTHSYATIQSDVDDAAYSAAPEFNC